jgi:predicted Zn-ribbon and HTH transcriptional regulator
MGTLRQQIIDLLCQQAMTALDISGAVRIPEKDVLRHLGHIRRTVVRQGGKLAVTPCTCRACGYHVYGSTPVNQAGAMPPLPGKPHRSPGFPD